MSRDGCVALPHVAMGLSAVCYCGITDHTHLLFFVILTYHFCRFKSIKIKIEVYRPDIIFYINVLGICIVL